MMKKLAIKSWPIKISCTMVACLLSVVALADPEEDYQRGLEAFRTDNQAEAMRILQGSAGGGHLPSMVLLAEIMDQAEDNVAAVKWYREAAEKDDLSGAVGLGEMYLKGEGVPQDNNEAFKWFSKAADKGYAPAMFNVAQIYRNGLGIHVDTQKSLEWLLRSAQLNYTPAIRELVQVYRKGLLDLDKNPKEADHWEAVLKSLPVDAGTKP